VRPSEVILSESLDLRTLGITFHARHSKGVLESRQAILPSNDGSFPTIQLSLSLSMVRSFSYILSITGDITAAPRGGEYLHLLANDDRRHNEKQAQEITSAD
jgi:hypothetical protein